MMVCLQGKSVCIPDARHAERRHGLVPTTVQFGGDVSRGMGHGNYGQHDEAKHQQKNDKVEQDQKPQEGEVGADPRAKHPYSAERGGMRERAPPAGRCAHMGGLQLSPSMTWMSVLQS